MSAHTRREVRQIMADLGLPYEAKTAASFLSATRSAGESRVVAATPDMDAYAGGSVFYGCYPAEQAHGVAARIKRVRRIRVLSVDVIAPSERTY